MFCIIFNCFFSTVDILPLPVVEPEVKMNSIEIQAGFPSAVAEEPPKKRRRSSGTAPGKGTCTLYTLTQYQQIFGIDN